MTPERARKTHSEAPKTISLPKEFSHKPLLKKIQITNMREGKIEGFSPISIIEQEDVPVDEDHVRELTDSIRAEGETQNNTGQLSPILLAEVPGLKKLLIIDGFHRTAALKSLGRKEIYTIVRPDYTMEDVIDLRILTAVTHRSVRFSRILEWVEEAWTLSPWVERLGVASAFTLRFLPGQTGKRHHLNEDEVEEVRNWVDKKCKQWKVTPNVVHRNLQIAAAADPELVKAARERPGGDKLEAITPRHLGAIVKYLPNLDNYALQHLAAEAATNQTLTVSQTRSLALALSKTRSLEEATEVVRSGSWRSIDALYRPHTKARYKKEDMTEPDTYTRVLRDKFFDDQITVAQIMIENAVLTGNYNPHSSDTNNRVRGLLLSKDLLESIQDEPVAPPVLWDKAKVEKLTQDVFGLKPLLISAVRKKFGLNADDGEDIFSTIVEKFMTRVSDGRVPSEYPDPRHLQRLLLGFVDHTTIDYLRQVSGRGENRRYFVSLDDEGGSDDLPPLKERIGTEDPGFDEVDQKNVDFLKYILPHLNERERRTLVLKGYFLLSHYEIAQVIGTTEGTINQTFRAVKDKIAKITQTAEE